MLADADLCLLGLGSGIGLDSVVKLLGDRGAKPSSCLAEEIQLLVERLGSLFHCVIKLLGGIRRCRAAWHRQGLGGMLEATTGVRSSCLAGTLVALGRQAVWRPGDIGVVSSNRLAARCKQYLFRSGFGGLVRPDPVTWRRLGLRRSRTTHQDKMCRSSQDTSFLRFSVMTHMSRHIVVAPIPSAPLLTDTRRSTVGPGTLEDVVPSSCCVRSAVLVVEYIALALAVFAAPVSVTEHIAVFIGRPGSH